MKKRVVIPAVIAAAVILLGVGGYFWYPTTPLAAMHTMQQAVKAHDWERFSSVVDVEGVADGAGRDIGLIIQETLEKRKLAQLLSKGITALVTIKVRSGLTQDLKDLVMGTPLKHTGILAKLAPADGGETAVHLKGIHWWGDTGEVTLGLGSGTRLKCELKKVNGQWKITRLLNVRELFEQSRKKKPATPS